MSGEFHHIPIDEKIICLARWAVDEYNKEQNINLEFRGVWSAQEQIVAGSRYRIVLEGALGSESNKYEALVFVPLTGDKKLEEFNPLLQAQA